ncbi:hypothetical protein MMPV_009884 [Pyropia vietnamensis]
MVQSLGDPHTHFLDASALASTLYDMDGDVDGVGVVLASPHPFTAAVRAVLRQRPPPPTVVEVLPGSPAEAGGVAQGDTLLAVDGVRVGGSDLWAVAARLSGPPRSSVTITLSSSGGGGGGGGGGTRAVREVTLRRARLAVPTVYSELVRVPAAAWGGHHDAAVAYLRVTQFSAHTGGQVRAALARLHAQLDAVATAPRALPHAAAAADGSPLCTTPRRWRWWGAPSARPIPAPDAYVLDLRDNPGGILDEAVATAGAFLPHASSPVVSVYARDGETVLSAGSHWWHPSRFASAVAASLPVTAVSAVAARVRRSLAAIAAAAAAAARGQRGAPVATVASTGAGGHVRCALAPPPLPKWPPPLRSAVAGTPVAVLVNSRTASGGELVAAALRDACVGTLVGSSTYGKGSVQAVVEVSHGCAVAVTVAEYRRPSGVTIGAGAGGEGGKGCRRCWPAPVWPGGVAPDVRRRYLRKDAAAVPAALRVLAARPRSLTERGPGGGGCVPVSRAAVRQQATAARQRRLGQAAAGGGGR